MTKRVRLLEDEESSQSDHPPVRGRPFKPGNPGRPPGSKNKLTRLLEGLIEKEGEALTRKQIELANGGNVRCLESLMDRLVPKRSGRTLELQLPTIKSIDDIPAAIAAITNGVNDGDLTLEEGNQIVDLLEGYGRVISATDLADRVEKVELQIKQMKSLKGREDLIS